MSLSRLYLCSVMFLELTMLLSSGGWGEDWSSAHELPHLFVQFHFNFAFYDPRKKFWRKIFDGHFFAPLFCLFGFRMLSKNAWMICSEIFTNVLVCLWGNPIGFCRPSRNHKKYLGWGSCEGGIFLGLSF